MTAIRELIELDLASRNPPIIRITERGRVTDTEVSYQGVEDMRPRFKRWDTRDVDELNNDEVIE
jgi:hypothetical protein